eukprot:TRINITY_DN15450_c0_g1_i1.p1 TRINITY_DN15450_c0_g1~~TRINITY_DN15450_c0_g1_i1.p1  ORF type:complete len:223 (+),score=60.48 TRINITY_DN15450_c0_g1_i1:70-738(+)
MCFFFFFFKQKTAYEMLRSLVGSEMCIRDSPHPLHGSKQQHATVMTQENSVEPDPNPNPNPNPNPARRRHRRLRSGDLPHMADMLPARPAEGSVAEGEEPPSQPRSNKGAVHAKPSSKSRHGRRRRRSHKSSSKPSNPSANPNPNPSAVRLETNQDPGQAGSESDCSISTVEWKRSDTGEESSGTDTGSASHAGATVQGWALALDPLDAAFEKQYDGDPGEM